ncbi:Fc receptor-like protein 5 isoform X2 [Acanthopagrus latus]|uniref:Fc receptor-like protein 5 isoform X2 n=1 Tax=Acanthopagrus latus TaxID=8177 RepID=UPI00187C70B0|nr:Fc receptor-like protein 5 isoform X2 [Acanthopagrus latus]
MEVTALSIRLSLNLLMLLVGHVLQSYPQKTVSDAALYIIPTRLQVFEYESISFTCEGGDGLKVRNIKKIIPKCSVDSVMFTVTCTIECAYKSDSGEYWCEGGGGERSNTVNITVTDGSVILESPVLPVTEWDDVTLSCRKKNTFSNLPADFYKDGLHVGSSSTGEMSIHSVSKSDKGLYKCNISGVGESPESWLAVRDAAFRIVPTRLQVNEYESVSFTCEGINISAGWRVRNIKKFVSKCSIDSVMLTVTCTIEYVYKSDSGEYWCEGRRGERSNTVHITVTDGSVILESPVLPVTEQNDVTVCCRTTSNLTSNQTADFRKDGVHVGNNSTGETIIHNVSKSDEGLYKWNNSGAGESPESWLAVRDAAVIVPTRLQVYEYESVSFTCLGVNVSAGWRVRNIKKFFSKCSVGTEMFTVTCTIDYAYKSDSGEYWCEGGGGERSNTVNITVTDGSVILESPVLPVVERDAVTLSCRKKTTSSNLTADFYKDGHHVGSSSTGTLTIHSVSMSDEGLYKCNISGAGESPESWLTVRDGSVILKIPVLPVMEGDAVTLQCRNKQSSSNLPADFYREGLLIGNSLVGEMTIHRVSKSD